MISKEDFLAIVLTGLLLVIPQVLWGKTIKVAVIDTGIQRKLMTQKNGICKTGHKDYSKLGLNDMHGHGTNISGLIHKYAGNSDYCQVVLKFYNPTDGDSNLINTIRAIHRAIKLKVDIINYSGGGYGFSNLEKAAIKKALAAGIFVVVAAGNGIFNVTAARNEGLNLDERPYYPAAYDKRVIVVGNGFSLKKRAVSSNYGSIIDGWVDGTNKVGSYGKPMTGTSQSTAIVTGRLIKKLYDERSK